jgi:phosphoribosyl-AMP cyclohydrolase
VKKWKSGRSKNFSTNEINLLIMLVDSNKKVAESKKTGTVTNKEKAKIWGKIALSFNSQTIEGINRDAKVLKVDQFQTCDGEKIRFRQDQ